MMNASHRNAFDVAVIGAGPAGAATARALSLSGCRVLLVERSAFNAVRVGETLAPSVQPLLSALGVWDRFLALDPLPSWGTRSLWGGPDAQEHSHVMSPYGCGWHVDRQRFDRMLADAAASAGATLCTETRLIECEARGRTSWCLTLARTPRTSAASCSPVTLVTADVVVDATGRQARLARRLGARRLVIDKLVGLTTQFTHLPTEDQCYTLIEAAADGWWYSAPVGDNRLITMLMTDSDLCGRLDLASSDVWTRHLGVSDVTAARIGNAPRVWGPRPFSALSHRLCRDDDTASWVAVGDAALAVDPASGSGVVRALRSAHAGAEAALARLQRASPDAVEQYEADLDHEWTRYLQERAMYYEMEPRWRESPFWQRRSTPLPPPQAHSQASACCPKARRLRRSVAPFRP